MKNSFIYFKEISSTVYETDCTFSLQKITKKEIDICKNALLDHCFSHHGIKTGHYTIDYLSNGKPYLSSHPDIFFNLSHTTSRQSKDYQSCIAIGISDSEIGVDVEYERILKPSLIKKMCSKQEICLYEKAQNQDAFLVQRWTLKEAYSKYTGEGIRIPFDSLNFIEKESDSHKTKFALENHPEVELYLYNLTTHLWLSVCIKTGANAPVPFRIS